MSRRRRLARGALAVGLVPALALPACGGDDGAHAVDHLPPAAGAPGPGAGSSATSAPAASPEDEVLRDYRLATEAVVAASNPPDPERPDLVRYWGGDALAGLQSQLAQWRALEVGTRSEVQTDAEVTSISGDRATVRDCYVDTSQVVDLVTGQPAGPPASTTQHVDVTLEHRAGIWVAVHQEIRSDPCPLDHRLTRARIPAGLLALASAASACALAVVASAGPAAADPPPPVCARCGANVSPVDAGFLARARSDADTLNRAASSPAACERDIGGETPLPGVIRYLRASDGEGIGPGGTGLGSEFGVWYRKVCWVAGFDEDTLTGGGLIDLVLFQVSPQALAQLALDEALAGIGTHTLHTSPGGQSLVGLDTWYWADGVPSEVSASAGVPGVVVDVTAVAGNLEVDPGDGRPAVVCPGLGVAWSVGATSTCTSEYQRAGTYTVTATLDWTATYTIGGAGPFPVNVPIGRVATIDLAVAQAQAIND